MWGSIIGAGIQTAGGLLGGLLGGNKDTYHPEVWRNDAYKNYIKSIQAIKDAANKHGFHPLALLGSNPGSSLVQPVSNNAGGNMGLGDAIGAGISAFGDLYGESQLNEAEAQEGMRQDYVRSREAALQRLHDKELTPERKLALENQKLQNDVLRLDIATSRTRLANARNTAIGATGPAPVLIGPGGMKFSPVPDRAPAQDAEDQYGEAGDLLFGTGGFVEDLTSGRIDVAPNFLGRAENWWNDLLRSRRYPGSATPKRYPGG